MNLFRSLARAIGYDFHLVTGQAAVSLFGVRQARFGILKHGPRDLEVWCLGAGAIVSRLDGRA